MRPVDEEAVRGAAAAGLVEAVRRESGSPGPAQLPTVEAACADLAAGLRRLRHDGTAPLAVEQVAGLADGLVASRITAPVPPDAQAAVDRLAAARDGLETLRGEVRRAEAAPDTVTRVGSRRLVRQLLRRRTR